MLGIHVAELDVIPEGAAIRIERTFAKQPGHHTIWGDSDELLGYVARIFAISNEEQDHEDLL